MPTTRETILQFLLTARQSIPAATVLRGAILPERIPAGGLVILRDGKPASAGGAALAADLALRAPRRD